LAVRLVRENGEDILREPARPVKRFDDSLRRLIEDMFDTMYCYQGVGLAAPQIGVPKRIIVMDVEGIKLELINPEILETHGEDVDSEGCLSVPGVYGEVKRAARVRVRGQRVSGETCEIEAAGLLSRCFQHEIDHLNGILFIDRAVNLERVRPSEEEDE